MKLILWWACEHVERPPDPYVVWHYANCQPCRIKAQALAATFPDDEHVAWLNEQFTESAS